MNSLHLKALLLAVDHGSISKAARLLGKKQPQVSQWISDLEADFGITFFERTGNRSLLSVQGECMLPYLRHALASLEKMGTCARLMSQGEPTQVRIGLEHYIPEDLFLGVFSQLLKIPNVSLELYREEGRQLEQDLIAGATNIIVKHETDVLHHLHFHYQRLGDYQEGLVCSPRLPLTSYDQVSASELSTYKELIWGNLGDDENVDGLSTDFAVISDFNLLKCLLEKGLGYAYLPVNSIAKELEQGSLQLVRTDFEQDFIRRRVELCWLPGFPLSHIGQQVLTLFQVDHALV
ncbi:TPA: LysR family transcriptional regulator [Vibrio vulnificus]|nr:LysR family transcriptional regulator [Vibrio vulnificus]HAS6323631.1 LysR family transcriptional regulator [Vibrio vulnificus]HAT8517196.1 LysR family transcriptional regulator [Vibrio vulnificus]HDY7550911.1 LysR family transcriptional regulator [Vibrio vulnificus]HDY7920866.1 LysR family transcriptional regulator [Vibrio vulnificus]